MLFTTLVILTLLCLALPITRVYAVIGAGLLLYLYPLLTIGTLLFMGGAWTSPVFVDTA
jgi:hypothetical protein